MSGTMMNARRGTFVLSTGRSVPRWRKADIVYVPRCITRVDNLDPGVAGTRVEAVQIGGAAVEPKAFPWRTCPVGKQIRITLANETLSDQSLFVQLHVTEGR